MVRMGYGPDGFEARNTSLLAIIQEAYGVQANQIVGAPDWVNTSAFDIKAKAEGSDSTWATDPRVRQPEIRNQLQSLLADRFKLALHHEQQRPSSYALEVGEAAPNFSRQNMRTTPTQPQVRMGKESTG